MSNSNCLIKWKYNRAVCGFEVPIVVEVIMGIMICCYYINQEYKLKCLSIRQVNDWSEPGENVLGCNGDCSCTGMWTQYTQFSCFWEEIGNSDHWVWNCWQLVTFLKNLCRWNKICLWTGFCPMTVDDDPNIQDGQDLGDCSSRYILNQTNLLSLSYCATVTLIPWVPWCLTVEWEKPCFIFHLLPGRGVIFEQFSPYLTGSPCNTVLGINSESPEGEGAWQSWGTLVTWLSGLGGFSSPVLSGHQLFSWFDFLFPHPLCKFLEPSKFTCAVILGYFQ